MSLFNQTSEENSRSLESWLHLISLVVNSVSDLVGLLVNLTLIFHIFRKQITRHVQRAVQSLIANLAVFSILEMVFRYTNTGDQTHLINVPGELCSLVSYLRSVVHTGFLVNISVIIYERLKSFQDTSSSRSSTQVHAYLLILLIWGSSALFSVPTALMKTSRGNPIVKILEMESDNHSEVVGGSQDEVSEKVVQGTCKSVHLLGTWELTIMYESLRLIVLHVGVGAFMMYAVLEIRSKLRYLTANSTLPKERLDKKANTIRLLLFYLLSFVIVALPFGIIIFYRRIAPRLIQTTSLITRFFDAFEIVLTPALLFYFYMSPLLSHLFLEGFAISRSDIFFCGTCLFGGSRASPAVNAREQRETSLIATCGPSSEENEEAEQIKDEEKGMREWENEKRESPEITITDTGGKLETLV